jgi:predicted molibdopterin-dependent oxidoreductase YjgC
VELHPDDAEALGVADGDLLAVRSRRGEARGLARLSGIEPGVVFMPFHYGDWDDPDRKGAANALTISGWDAVSKQPYVKYAAVSVRRVAAGDGGVPADPYQVESSPEDDTRETERGRGASRTRSRRAREPEEVGPRSRR